MMERPIRLLLIDDDRQQAGVFRKELEASLAPLFDVRRVTPAAAARRSFVGDVDVAVLAVRDQGDLDLLAAVLTNAAGVPVIALTAAKDEGYGMEAMRRGAHEHIVRDHGGVARIERCLRDAAERQRILDELQRSTAALEQSEIRRTQAKEAADALTDASRGLIGALSVGDVLERTLGAVQRLFQVQHALMYRLDEPARTLELVGQSHDSVEARWIGHTLPPGVGVAGLAVAEGRAVWSADVLADARITQSPSWRDRLRASGCTAVMGVPLRVKTGVWGALVVMDNLGRTFGDDDARLLSAFGDQAALALDNARLHEETETRLRQTETLVLVGHAVTSTLNVTEVMRRLAREAGRALHPDVVGAYLADADGTTLRPVAGYRVPKALLPETSSRVLAMDDHQFLREAFATRRPVGGSDAGAAGVTWAGQAFGSLLFVPMIVKDRPIGGLFLAWWQAARRLRPEDFRLVEAIAGQGAVAADHARLYEETERRRRVAEELAHTGRLLTTTLDMSEVAQRTAGSVLRLFGAHSSIVRLLQPDGALRLLAAAGVSAEKLPAGHVAPAGEGIVGRAVVEGRAVWASDDLGTARGVLSASFADVLDRVGHRAVLAVPLRLEDRTIGVLALAHQQARSFSADDTAVLEAFADQVVLAMENARLYAETERRRREAEALAEVGGVLSQGLDPEVVARRITDHVRDLLHAQSAAIYGLDRSSGALVALRASTNVADTFQWTPVLARGTGLGSRALHLRQPQASPDTAADPRITYSPDVRAENELKSHRALLTVPLFVGERAFGVLAVGGVTGRVFTEDEIGLARRFGDQAVLALDNARLHAETERRGREAEVIAGLAATLNASLDLDATLQAVATAARELCGSDAARIALPDPGTDAMVFRYLDGDDPAAFEGVRIRAGDGAGGHVMTTGVAFRTDDYFSDTRISHPFDAVVRGQGVRAQVIVPIYGGRRLEGLLYVVNKRPAPFSDRAEAVLVRLADHAAIAIGNAQSFEREHAARAAAEALAELSRLVSETVDPAELAERITGSLRALIEASNAALYRLDDDGDLRALGVSIEDRTTFTWPPTVAKKQGTMGMALRERCTVTSADVLLDPRLHFDAPTRARLAKSEFRAVLTVPLVAQDRILGVLAVGGRVGRVFEPEHVRLAEAFANQAALAIENARLFSETQERRREAELIADLARTINASLDLDTVLRRITEGARELCGTDAARISLREPATGFVSRYSVGYRGPESAAMRVEPGVGVAGKALVTGRACRLHDVADEAGSVGHYGEAVRADGIVTSMAAPLVIDGQVEGVLHVDGRSARRFSDGDELGLQRLADHAAITLRNVRSFEREQAARTDAQRTAAALGESEEKMRVIVETALDAVVTMDAAGAITGWNAQAEAVFGWPRAQMLGRQLSDFLQIGEGPVVNRRVETLARRRDGLEIPVEMAVATARMGGAVTFSAFIRDITERRRAEQREAVQFAVTRWLAESPTLSDAMPGLLRTIAEGLRWVCGQSWLIDRASDVMRWESAWCSAGPGLDALLAASRSTTFERGGGIVGRVWQSGGPVWVEDIGADPAFRLLHEARAADLKAMVAFPIRSGGNMSGVMTFFTRESRSVDGELIEVLADIGGQIGQFAERRRAEDEAAARARQQSAVAELSRVALTGAELDEVMEQAVRLLARTLDAPVCRILELSADGDRLLLRAATGLREGLVNHVVVPTGEDTQSGYTLLCREPVIVDDMATESRFKAGPVFQEYGVASGMTVTIEGHERPFGVLGVHTLKQRRFTSDDAHFLQAMAGVIGAAFERRRAEAIIRESERRYRLLADNISDVIWVRDLNLRLTYASPSAARLFGFTPEEMMGQGLPDLLTPESLQRAGESIAALTAQAADEPARSLTLELEARRKDGSTVWTETSVTILRGADGVPASLLGVARDITARKRAEDALRRSEEQLRQAQKMEAIGRLAGGVAHDFNNIMTIIDGRSELMLAKLPADQPVRRDVDIIRGAARRATGLTRQLLAFSRKQVLQPRVLDLNAVVASMMDLLRRLIGEDIELITVPGAELHRVQADPGQLEQVMMNLAVNARDAMPAGGRLTIATSDVVLGDPAPTDAPGAQAGPHVMLSVTDTGTGMDEATRARVFDPFFTTKGPGKGTGLGLSMVYGIVTQSGGRVAVTSAPGTGSTFTVWLPAVLAPADVAATPGPDGAMRGTETILLVEDEEDVRDLAQELLESLGYVVVTAANGSQALRVCARREQRVDLMLTDIIMPQMSGKETALGARRLRADLKVLYMSGYTDDALGRHGVADAHATLLEKPFTRQSLARKVREALDHAG